MRRPQAFLQDSVVQDEKSGSEYVGFGVKTASASGLDCMYLEVVSDIIRRRKHMTYGVSVWIKAM